MMIWGAARFLETLLLVNEIWLTVKIVWDARLLATTVRVASNVLATASVSSAASVTLFTNGAGTVGSSMYAWVQVLWVAANLMETSSIFSQPQ